MQIDAGTAAVLAASVSGLCSAITAIGIVAFTKRSDERRHLRELVVRTATENWKVVNEAAKEAGESRLPLDVYILHMLKFSEILLAKNLKPDEIAAKLREVQKIVDIGIESAIETTSRTRQQDQQE